MDRITSWQRQAGMFRGQRSISSEGSLRQSLVGADSDLSEEDLESSRHVHWSASTRSLTGLLTETRPPETSTGGEYVKSIVYGGLDAIVTSFALVASVSGGGIGSGAVLVLGFANLIADGISMGFGDYLSTSTEQAYAGNEQKIADWDCENDLHAQAMNMVEVYENNGMAKSDAEEVVRIFSKYKEMLADQKLMMQDGLMPPDEEEEAWKNGIVTFISFLCFGCTPLLSFVVLSPFTDSVQIQFIVACFVTAFALILLGVAKARLSGDKWYSSAFSVLCNGGLAAAAAYFISWSLKNLLGIRLRYLSRGNSTAMYWIKPNRPIDAFSLSGYISTSMSHPSVSSAKK